MTAVRLTDEELEFAAIAGAIQQARARAVGLAHSYGYNGDGWGVHIEGTAAELAVAKALNRYYVPALHPQRKGEADVGPYQVRSTERRDGCLILHPEDASDEIVFLVIGRAPDFDVVGWICAVDGKRPEFWQTYTGRPAYFVPQSALRTL